VEWNTINKMQSRINVSAFSFSNPTPIIAFAQTKKIIDDMIFFILFSIVSAGQKLKLLEYGKS
jgi:hypothetical protein